MRIFASRIVVIAAAVAAAPWGCGTAFDPSQAGQGGDAGASSHGGNHTGGSGSGNGTGGGDFGGSFGQGSGDAGGDGQNGAGGMACAGSAVEGQLIPVDMYIMLDRSGSMLDKTGANADGPTKWEAVTAALQAFIQDPASDGLGVGLQFFPLFKPGVPDTCTSHGQCGAGGPCLLAACESALVNGDVTACTSDSDCGIFDQCIALGQCQNDTSYVCIYQSPEVSCGGSLGMCKPMTESFCVSKDTCDAADYASPAVEISTLNGAASALSDAIAQAEPGGATPTSAALDGAIGHARAWASVHPDHRVVTVLATDGMPTECEPQDIPSIAGIAQAGKEGAPGILTFVIGVFSNTDLGAQQNLDQIAQEGGTGSAFFITDDQDVTQAFLDALRAIQGQTLSCEYQMPEPPDGNALDYDKVNVEYTPAGQSAPATVFYVGEAADCDAALGGWYYDQDPAAGQVPTKMLMCPATCDELKSIGGKIDIQIGCQTIVPEPK